MFSAITATVLFAAVVCFCLFFLIYLVRDKEDTHRQKTLSYVAAVAGIITGVLMLRLSIHDIRVERARKDTAWVLVSDRTTATVYNPVPEQCNADFVHTASMFTIDPKQVHKYHIVAMERTMMKAFGIKWGDEILVVGTGRWDGVWQVEDTMNKRFAGQHKIDFLVPNHIRHGKWENVKVYKRNQSI